MKLYLVDVKEYGYDDHDAVVICAENEMDAIKAVKENEHLYFPENEKMTCKEVGIAHKRIKKNEIVIASFNAG